MWNIYIQPKKKKRHFYNDCLFVLGVFNCQKYFKDRACVVEKESIISLASSQTKPMFRFHAVRKWEKLQTLQHIDTDDETNTGLIQRWQLWHDQSYEWIQNDFDLRSGTSYVH